MFTEPTPLVVTLTWDEIGIAAMRGCARHIDNLQTRRPIRMHGLVGDDWQCHVDGALGECAVAKALGVYWNGAIGDTSADDVDDWQVRSTRGPTNRLIVHKTDHDDKRYILVRADLPRFILVGWILGRDAKRDEWWTDPTGKGRWAYFVPASALHPLPVRVRASASAPLTASAIRW